MTKRPYILLLVASLFSQDFDGDISFGEISFLIRNIHFGGNYSDRSKYADLNRADGSLDIGLIKYGFSNIEISGDVNAYNERAKVKYKFSGPEFEMSNLKINLSFEAPNVWNLLKKEMEHERGRKPRYVFSDISSSVVKYYKTYNEFPSDIDVLFIKGLLTRSSVDIKGWDFQYFPPGQILAISNETMSGGAGKKIKYIYNRNIVDDFKNDNYNYYTWETSGYGQRDSYHEPSPVTNTVMFSIGKVDQYFGASGYFDLSEHNQLVEFKLDKVGYSVSSVNASFIVDRNSKSTFNISDFRTEAKNVFLEFESRNQVPTIENAAFQISLKNLEVNVPRDVEDDPEFKEIADYLNINSGKFRIRQIDLDLTFNKGKDLHLKGIIDTQFGKANINGSVNVLQQGDDSEFTIDLFTVEINNLSRPINNYIEMWERETGNTLPRKGSAIVLEISGDLNRPTIKGLDL